MDCEHNWRHCTSDEPFYAEDGSYPDEWWQCVRCNHIAAEDPTSPLVPIADKPRCFRHQWREDTLYDGLRPDAYCLRCGKVRDEAVRRRNRGNKNRGGAFERSIATKLGARRTGPLGGRDDVLGETVAVQTKKTINFSVRQARKYLDDLSRTYPTRTPLVIHAEPGRDREAVVILRLSDWLELHGPDGVKEPA